MVSSVVCGGILVVGELAMRATGWPDPGLYEGDRALVWWLRPSLERTVTEPNTTRSFQVRTTALGFRETNPPADGDWTLAVGCSTTFGWGVEASEAWPAQLSDIWGEPVVNGGVPGWSSLQGVRGLGRLMGQENRPTRVILGFGVRDLQRSARPDAAARATHWLHQTRWSILLRGTRTRTTLAPGTEAGVRRVSEEDVVRNLHSLVAQVRENGAEPILLWFPQPEGGPGEEELARLQSAFEYPPLLTPKLERSLFFPDDPIHLTPVGHRTLARWLAPCPPCPDNDGPARGE